MSGSDPQALEQYRDDANLNARINLHRRFKTNPISWNRWVFDQMRLAAGGRVLELGAGTGVLWRENQDRLPARLGLVVTDSSEGMLRAAREQLDEVPGVEFRQMDAARIRDGDRIFDVVIANHMLYHVPDRTATFSEVVRVLRPNGRFYAATNGTAHMEERVDRQTREAGDDLDMAVQPGERCRATCSILWLGRAQEASESLSRDGHNRSHGLCPIFTLGPFGTRAGQNRGGYRSGHCHQRRVPHYPRFGDVPLRRAAPTG